jgi:hypothetical protein
VEFIEAGTGQWSNPSIGEEEEVVHTSKKPLSRRAPGTVIIIYYK